MKVYQCDRSQTVTKSTISLEKVKVHQGARSQTVIKSVILLEKVKVHQWARFQTYIREESFAIAYLINLRKVWKRMSHAVEMKDIYKSFGTNNVLKGVDFTLEKGSIHALLGENGAGKSTLMNILGGLLEVDKGTISVTGTLVSDQKSVIDEKIGFVHQELSLVNDLNIFENLFLGNEKKKGIFLDKKAMSAEAQATLDRMGVDIDPYTMVSELSPSYKQIVEIARAMMKNAEVIIMDEPTTSLTDVEIEKIFEVMGTLKKQGISLIFISHKLNEVIEICDSYTILRDGNLVAKGAVTIETTEKELSTHMVGAEVQTSGIYQERQIGDLVLELKGMSRPREYQDVNMNVRKGEIVGVTGLMGDGRTELFASVAGANHPYEGSILVNGKEVTMKRTSAAKFSKLGYVPKNRKENAIIKDLSVEENLVLPIMKNISRVGLIETKQKKELVASYVEKLNIKVSDTTNMITSLSGGNQQKVVLSKVLSTNPEIIILDNPTQGVDIGAKMEIYRLIVELAKQGLSFIILSSEIPELQRVCDRAYVMFHGQIKQEFARDELTEENIMLVATGGTFESA